MLLKMIFIIQCLVLFIAPSFLLAKPVAITPLKQDNEIVLFDAKIHDLETISNYTACWREGSNINPVARKVARDGTEYVEFSFSGFRRADFPPRWEPLKYIMLKDCKQSNIHIFQMEWVNPRPEQMIQEVIFYHDNELDVTPILMAISGRSVRKATIPINASGL